MQASFEDLKTPPEHLESDQNTMRYLKNKVLIIDNNKQGITGQ